MNVTSVLYTTILSCVEAHNNVGTRCGFSDSLTNERCLNTTEKTSMLIVYIAVPLVLILLVVFLVVAVMIFLIVFVHRRRQRAKASETTTFRMKRSNVAFFPLKVSQFVCNVATLRFAGTTPESDPTVPVNAEITDTLCVGLVSKSTQRVLFTWMKSKKFTLTITLNVEVLLKGEACEFHATFTALCTTHVETGLQLVSVNVYRGKQHQTAGPTLDVETQLSTSLDADELVAEEQIGKGSFGVVSKGKTSGTRSRSSGSRRCF